MNGRPRLNPDFQVGEHSFKPHPTAEDFMAFKRTKSKKGGKRVVPWKLVPTSPTSPSPSR